MTFPRTLAAIVSALVCLPVLAQEAVPVESGSPMTYLANASDPGIGLAWTLPAFDDSSWALGVYGVGYELGTGAENLIQTAVPSGTFSIYTRTTFNINDVSAVSALEVGADYDDGYVVWINGVEVFRSAEMPAGAPGWNTSATNHESSNAQLPVYDASTGHEGRGTQSDPEHQGRRLSHFPRVDSSTYSVLEERRWSVGPFPTSASWPKSVRGVWERCTAPRTRSSGARLR